MAATALASLLPRRRRQLGLTHLDVARRAGLAPTTVARYELGRVPRRLALQRVGSALALPYGQLVALAALAAQPPRPPRPYRDPAPPPFPPAATVP